MSVVSKRLALAAATLLVGAGAFVATASSSSDPARCEIVAEKHGAGVSLIGLYFAAKALDGEYTFRVRGSGRSGSTDIAQGGEFSAGPGQPVEVGQVTLGGSAASYQATLVIKAGGKTVRCEERIGRI
ncbi:MAG: curli-like amyloid fiber formation chaperone CsgH [Mesorhizobium sp.]